MDEDKKEENKIEEIKNEEINNKDVENSKKDKNKNGKKEKKDNKKYFGKLKVNPDVLKPKKRMKKLSSKEIIFSRVCKYIFYSIILFTIYVLVRKLLELLDIIDPQASIGQKDVKINNKEEKNKQEEVKSKEKENEIIMNKKKEQNKLN